MFAHGVQRMNVGARTQQLLRRPPFVVERYPVGGNRHQGRRAARQQNDQRVAGLNRAGDGERPSACALAAVSRQRMAADDCVEPRGHVGVARADHEAGGDAGVAEETRGGRGHRRRGFASSDHVRGTGARTVRYGLPSPVRTLQQSSGVGRTNPGPDDRQEILSKLR